MPWKIKCRAVSSSHWSHNQNGSRNCPRMIPLNCLTEVFKVCRGDGEAFVTVGNCGHAVNRILFIILFPGEQWGGPGTSLMSLMSKIMLHVTPSIHCLFSVVYEILTKAGFSWMSPFVSPKWVAWVGKSPSGRKALPHSSEKSWNFIVSMLLAFPLGKLENKEGSLALEISVSFFSPHLLNQVATS